MSPMDSSEFDFDLPPDLIAQQALPERSASRLLHVGAGAPAGGCDDLSCADLHFRDLPGLLRPGDLLVGNDTRVLPARLFGQKATGGKVELLLERVLRRDRCAGAAALQSRAEARCRPALRARRDGGGDRAPGRLLRAALFATRRRRAGGTRPHPAAALHPPGRRAGRPAALPDGLCPGAGLRGGTHRRAALRRGAARGHRRPGRGVPDVDTPCGGGHLCAPSSPAAQDRPAARRASRPSPPNSARRWPRAAGGEAASSRSARPPRAAWKRPASRGSCGRSAARRACSSGRGTSFGSWTRWSPIFICPVPRC